LAVAAAITVYVTNHGGSTRSVVSAADLALDSLSGLADSVFLEI
jgi:hypothetical protein